MPRGVHCIKSVVCRHFITNILIQSKGVKMNDICPRNWAFFIMFRFSSRYKLVRTDEFLKFGSTRKMKAY